MTGEAHALKALFGENSSGSASYKLAVATVCSRLSGVFASLKVASLSPGSLLLKGAPTLPLPSPYFSVDRPQELVAFVLWAPLHTDTYHLCPCGS